MFATAYASEIAREFSGMGVPVIEKPYDAQLIVRTVRLLSNDGEACCMASGILVTGRCRAA